MKLTQLKQLLEKYDQERGFFRRFKDRQQVSALRKYIVTLEQTATNQEQEITYQAFTNWLDSQKLKIDFSPAYLFSNYSSAKIFRQWSTELNLQKLDISNITNISYTNLNILNLFGNVIDNKVKALSMPNSKEIVNSFISRMESDKKKSAADFWKAPETLRENCVQFVAFKLLEGCHEFNYQNLPEDIQEDVIKRLQEANKIINSFQETYQPINLDNFIKKSSIADILKINQSSLNTYTSQFFKANTSNVIILTPDVDPNAGYDWQSLNNTK